jgi:hypothetical protein
VQWGASDVNVQHVSQFDSPEWVSDCFRDGDCNRDCTCERIAAAHSPRWKIRLTNSLAKEDGRLAQTRGRRQLGTQEYGRYWRQAPGYSSGYCTQILDNMPAKRGFLPRAGTFGRGTNPPTSVDGVKTSPRGKPKVQPSATWCTPGAENSHL